MILEPVLQDGGHWQAATHFFKQIGSDVAPLRSTIITSDRNFRAHLSGKHPTVQLHTLEGKTNLLANIGQSVS